MIGLLGMRFGGGLCGLISMLLLFFSPRFFGHSMNNLKDIPFAVGYWLPYSISCGCSIVIPCQTTTHDRGHAGNRFGIGNPFRGFAFVSVLVDVWRFVLHLMGRIQGVL